ncbi:hypothetical protein B296_00039681 [Ensete ventricosum]|uniref:Uncharacterized protein n=1 Tax=Ensete ventricosum TaxID=4639 RepID=A0A426Y5L2_ENSVE|nr:hypothetical protein B296_00039681 [Ensete ventricosum]
MPQGYHGLFTTTTLYCGLLLACFGLERKGFVEEAFANSLPSVLDVQPIRTVTGATSIKKKIQVSLETEAERAMAANTSSPLRRLDGCRWERRDEMHDEHESHGKFSKLSFSCSTTSAMAGLCCDLCDVHLSATSTHFQTELTSYSPLKPGINNVLDVSRGKSWTHPLNYM